MTETGTAEKTAEELDLLNASDDDLAAMGLPPRLSLDDLKSFLTDEEIARANEGDDPLVKMPEKDGKSEGDEDNPDGEDDPEAGGQADEGAQEGEDAAAPAEKTTASEEITFADDTPDPSYEPKDTTEAKKLIEGAADERAKLRDQWNDGDMTDADFDKALDELNDRITDAKVELKQAERDEAQAHETLKDVWFGKVDRFLEANPTFKSAEAVEKLGGDSYLTVFDKALRAISGDARYAGLSLNERIEAGARITQAYVKQQTGADMMPTAKAEKPAAKAKEEPADPLSKARQKVAEEGKRPDAVQTLGNVTAASATEADSSRFAQVDKQEGSLARERAFAQLSAEEQEAYLMGR